MKNTTKYALMGIAILIVGLISTYLVLNNAQAKPANKQDERICTMDYNPVCGVDGITYGNKCMAQGTEIAYEGECNLETSGTFPAGSDIPNLNDEELAAS